MPADAAPEVEVVETVEIVPQDGLTVVETDTSNDPLPSVPVVEEAVQPAPAPADGAMSYLGTVAMDGMTGRGGARRPAAYPVVVKAADDRIVGVVVVGDPGDVCKALTDSLEAAGHAGAPFTVIAAMNVSRQQKLAAARAIATQQDPTLDRVGALMALGFTPETLA